jgi:hypothetical protein
MLSEEILLKLMRSVLQGVANVLGSMGIMALWFSQYGPHCAGDALWMLSAATAITLALPHEPPTARPHGRH